GLRVLSSALDQDVAEARARRFVGAAKSRRQDGCAEELNSNNFHWIFLHGLFVCVWCLILINEWKVISNKETDLCREGQKKPKKSSVVEVSFSAHGPLTNAAFSNEHANPYLRGVASQLRGLREHESGDVNKDSQDRMRGLGGGLHARISK